MMKRAPDAAARLMRKRCNFLPKVTLHFAYHRCSSCQRCYQTLIEYNCFLSSLISSRLWRFHTFRKNRHISNNNLNGQQHAFMLPPVINNPAKKSAQEDHQTNIIRLASSSSSSISDAISKSKSPSGVVNISDTPKLSKDQNYTSSLSSPSSLPILKHPWVSVWKQRDKNDCIIYLLGSTHYSPQSIRLANTLVQDVAPTLVFVEMCSYSSSLSRWTRFVQHQLFHHQHKQRDLDQDNVDLDPSVVNILYPYEAHSIFQRIFGTLNTLPTRFVVASQRLQPMAAPPSTRRRLVFGDDDDTAAAADNMETVSFACEFCHTAWQGHVQGAWGVVFGDRNHWVTSLRYVWKNVTTLSRHWSHYVHVRRNLASFKKSLSQLDAEEATVDTLGILPTRETMQHSIHILEQVAPIYHQVMVQERDAYLAAGMTVVMKQLEQDIVALEGNKHRHVSCSMVAIVGKAHIHGVEQSLQELGWKQQEVAEESG